jgi:SAM-dependent methyltransferase
MTTTWNVPPLPDLSVISGCRSCGNAQLELVLPLGVTPLANSLLGSADSIRSQLRYPLDLLRCPRCTLVQLQQVISPERLFSTYVYFSSYSDAMLTHANALCDGIVRSEDLGSRSFVVEIGSNDGYLLQFFKKRGVRVLGIEPAQNIARVAQEKEIPTVARFFSAEVASELAANTQADVVIANNVLAHVPDLNGFMFGIRLMLKERGIAVFEVPYLGDMLEKVEFDTIYHEHQCYFSVTAVSELCRRNGLELVDVERLAIHGGSLRLFAAPADTRVVASRVRKLLGHEREWGVSAAGPYKRFGSAVRSLKANLVRLLTQIRRTVPFVAAYGAAAKGVTLLSYCGIGAETLDFVVDRSRYKQGLRFPIDGLPIVSPAALIERRPEYTLMLTWNFADEILRQQAPYRDGGGKFIIPLPKPRVV